MKKADVEARVSSLVKGIIEGTNLELVDVDYVRERDWYLRIFLDKPGSIDFDDCQMVSEKLGKALDEKDFIKDQYILEVSSPGIDRVLKKEKDYCRYEGSQVDIQLYKPFKGRKTWVATLKGHDDDTFLLDIEGQEERLERGTVAQMRLHVDF